MPYGIEIYDGTGKTVFDASYRIVRVIGFANLPAGAGSLSNAAFITGTPFFFMQPTGTELQVGSPAKKTISFSGTTMSWTAGEAVTVYYGVY